MLVQGSRLHFKIQWMEWLYRLHGLDWMVGRKRINLDDFMQELFLNKVGTSGNVEVSVDPQSSIQIMAPIKHDQQDVTTPNLEPMIDGVNEDVELMDDAQAPRTPGLLDEPNLSSAKETSACEDHFETEERHLSEAIMIENLDRVSGEKNNHDRNKHVDDWSIKSDTVIPMASEVGHHSSEPDVKKPQEFAVEQKSLDNHASASGPSSHVENHASSVSDLTELRHEENFDNVKDNVDFNGSLGDNERSDEGHLEKSNHGICLSANSSRQVLQNAPASSTMEASENIDNLDLDSQEKVEDRTSDEPQVLSLVSKLSKMDEHHHILVPCKARQNSNLEDNLSIDPKPCNEDVTPGSVNVSGAGDVLDASDMSGVAQGNAVLDGSENAALEVTTRDPDVDGLSHAGGVLTFAVDNGLSVENLMENIYSSGSPGVLDPEKLRSVTVGADNHPGSLVMDYTPGELVRNDEGDAGSNFISGKKRTYTESTLTEQSFYTVVSSDIAHSKRTVESVPDDDDLLSSILAGRKTSVLNLRPTPSSREITSVKRRRSAPHSGTTKRKVLVDDSMVLHGDTIRRQLMNTEDIRRVRKKAPCTRHEIVMIQKQFLEDEIFIEPICTGLAVELTSLHNQTRDLGGIVISVNDVDYASLELGINGSPKYNSENLSTEAVEGSSAQDVMRGHEKEEENEGLMMEENCGQETIDAPSMLMDVQDVNCMSSLHDNVIESKLKTITDAEGNSLLFEPTEVIAGTELDGRPDTVTDVVNATTVVSSLPSKLVSDDHVDISADLSEVAPSDDKSPGGAVFPDIGITWGDVTLHDNSTYMPRDQKANAVPLEEASPCEIGAESKDVGKDFDNVTTVEVIPLTDEQLLETAERNTTVETEACINSGEMEYTVGAMVNKEIEQMGSFPMDMDLQMENVLLDGAKFSCQGDGNYPLNMEDMDSLGRDYAALHLICLSVFVFSDFLNVDDDDDDDVVEATDDLIPNKDAIATDNSGWSSRTRAVANYLQSVFVKHGGNTRQTITMDNLLIGKTRKEASRMFFEALVSSYSPEHCGLCEMIVIFPISSCC
ncbi:hypothetical protein Leryth_013865 [Lithospermum erythrorhizon]|nr:hypothetical protein Leryth_013865 [Lithospermum erythrorhizon]